MSSLTMKWRTISFFLLILVSLLYCVEGFSRPLTRLGANHYSATTRLVLSFQTASIVNNSTRPRDSPKDAFSSFRLRSSNEDDVMQQPQRNTRKLILSSALLILMASLGVWKRDPIFSFLEYIKYEWLLSNLDRLNAAGPTGLVIYTFFFMLWEMTAGITTPIETAAGMAFGPVKGVVASGLGKTLGAFGSFCLARYIFYDKVQKAVEGNEFLELLEESIQETPLRIALLCRFSPLPEFAKNCGMGVMPVAKRWFFSSLFLHGFSFTCLWTFMGAETAAVLRGSPASQTLKYLLTGATWIGFGAPVLIGMWIKTLKDKQREKHQNQGKEKSN